jgi:hypothetical protein
MVKEELHNMTHSIDARASLRQALQDTAQHDERIVGLLEGGAGAEGRVDRWSDLDVFLFIRDTDLEGFRKAWKPWTKQFGHLLLAYNPNEDSSIAWTIFEAHPVPLRVDFRFIEASQIESVRQWPTNPQSLKTFVLCDKTDSQLSEVARSLVGHSQELPAAQHCCTFESHCNRMWYFLHSAFCKLERGDEWYARITLHIAVLDSLIALLKLEAGAVERWLASFPEWKLERALSAQRLSQLNSCIPSAGANGLRQAMLTIAYLGREVCEHLAGQHGWSWPSSAAEAVIEMLRLQ